MVYFHAKNPGLGGPWNEKCWHILPMYDYLVSFWPFGMFWSFDNFVVIWYIFPYFPLVFCTKKNLATLITKINS
jgi:hypothetical protein